MGKKDIIIEEEPTVPKEKLMDKVANKKVRYSLNVGRLSLRPRGRRVVQLENGGYADVDIEGFGIERAGARREDPWTREYDPSDSEDAKQIKEIDAFIEGRPSVAGSGRIGLSKLDAYDNSAPAPGWSQFSPEQIAVIATGLSDLEQAMSYELENENRLQVISILEREYAERNKVQADNAQDQVYGQYSEQ